MSIYGFYSTNLVLRRPETSATDKSHFCSFDAPSVYLSSFSVRRPIGFRPPSDQIPSAVQSDSVRHPIGWRSPYPLVAEVSGLRSTKSSANKIAQLAMQM